MRRALMLLLALMLLMALATPALATRTVRVENNGVTNIGGDVLAPAGTPQDVIAMVASDMPTPAPQASGGHLAYDYE